MYCLLIDRTYIQLSEIRSYARAGNNWSERVKTGNLSTFQKIAYSKINHYAETKSDAWLDDFKSSAGNNEHDPLYIGTFFL